MEKSTHHTRVCISISTTFPISRLPRACLLNEALSEPLGLARAQHPSNEDLDLIRSQLVCMCLCVRACVRACMASLLACADAGVRIFGRTIRQRALGARPCACGRPCRPKGCRGCRASCSGCTGVQRWQGSGSGAFSKQSVWWSSDGGARRLWQRWQHPLGECFMQARGVAEFRPRVGLEEDEEEEEEFYWRKGWRLV